MNASREIDRHQQDSQRQKLEQDGSHAFFDVLTSPALFATLVRLLPENHRERLFPPTETLSMFLTQALSQDRSCQSIVNRSAATRSHSGFKVCSTNTSGYCRARARLPLELPQDLAIDCGRAASDAVPDAWKCGGRPVRLVDGVTIAMPDTEENQAQYPQSTSQAPGLGFPQCRLVCLLCQASGALLDCEITPRAGKGNDEQSGLRAQLDVLERDDILIDDAYYCSYFLFCELMKRGFDAVFEQNGARRKKTDFRRGRRLGHNDHVVTLKKPEARPEWMSEGNYSARSSTCRIEWLASKAVTQCAENMSALFLSR